MAGLARTPVWRFLVWDLAGSLLWVGTFLTAGYTFSSEIERVAEWSLRLGSWLIVLAAAGLVTYFGWKYAQRLRLLRSLRIDRITPGELWSRLVAGEAVTIVDLRHSLEFDASRDWLPGAIRLDPTALAAAPDLLPSGREVVLYCS